VIGNLRDFDANEVASILRIGLGEKTYRLGFNEGTNLMPQRVKVFIRPLCLEIGIAQSHEFVSAGWSTLHGAKSITSGACRALGV